MDQQVKALWEKAAATIRLEEYLRTIPLGQVARHEAMEALTGKTTAQLRGSLRTARKSLRREKIYFVAVSGSGLLRVPANEASEKKHADTSRRVHNAVLDTKNLLQTIELADLPDDDRPKHVARMVQMEVIARCASSASNQKIQQLASNTQGVANIGQVLEYLAKGK